MQKENQIVSAVVVLLVLGSIAAFVLPWRNIDWGKISYKPAEVVTITGTAKTSQPNQIGSYSAGVEAVNDKKDVAVKEVNDKVAAIIEAVKKFGIESGDVKTANLSVYQNEEMYWDNGVQKSRKGQWRVSNQIEVKLRDITKASELADLLTNSGATNVYGPNFQMDDTSETEKGLFDLAMKDAKDKAEIAAKAAGRSLGKVISVNEGQVGGNVVPMYDAKMGMGGGGAPVEAGSGTVYKSLVVTFELK